MFDAVADEGGLGFVKRGNAAFEGMALRCRRMDGERFSHGTRWRLCHDLQDKWQGVGPGMHRGRLLFSIPFNESYLSPATSDMGHSAMQFSGAEK